MSLDDKWERTGVSLTDSIQSVLTLTIPPAVLPWHYCFYSPPTTLVFIFSALSMFLTSAASFLPPLPLLLSAHRDCDLLSVHANLFTPPAVLSPPSIFCLSLICNLIVVAGVIQFGCCVTGKVEDFFLHAVTDVALFIARLTGFSHISIAYLWGGGKWWRWFRGILWSVKFPVWRTLRWPQNDLWLFSAFINIEILNISLD